ncbi:uncharacterized protein CTRU02_200640 [Colletotrichum truncatum]|uniref:Uncharacterized protein n=1 Tax=Colletotrichum truncatum TaxID=5467 RepID=A0ACC3ZF93_COLTU
MRLSLVATTLLAAGSVAAVKDRSDRGKLTKSTWVIDNQYKFSSRSYWDFSKITDGKLPAGLKISDYPVDGYEYVPQNVAIGDGFLQLKVNKGTFKSGEVTTLRKVKYASVRTVAVLSNTVGVCNGMFFYQSDTQEADIEFLTNPNSDSNVDAAQAAGHRKGTRYIWLSNQAARHGSLKTTYPIPVPATATSAEHEYRLDWIPGMTRFFIDGVQVWNSSRNVPSVAGVWVFNNWSDGDKSWSAGPPGQDAIFKIREIDMYFNAAV